MEGATRDSTAEYCRFLQMALGSARECEYLLELCGSAGVGAQETLAPLGRRYNRLCGGLLAMLRALRPKP